MPYEASGPNTSTLYEVILALREKQGLKPTRRRDLTSAVKRGAHLMGVNPRELALDMRDLARRFNQVAPAVHGISAKTFTNLKSDFFAAIDASGLKPKAWKTVNTVLSPEWLALWSSLPEKRLQIGLSRFFKYVASLPLGPHQICDRTVERFLHDQAAGGLSERRLKNLRRQVPRLWNQAAAIVANWPAVRLRVPDQRPPRIAVDLKLLPPSFGADLENYAVWCRCTDPLDDNARPRALGEVSINGMQSALRVATAAAVESGIEKDRLVDLKVLIERDVFTATLRHLNRKAGNLPNFSVKRAANELIDVARYWAKVDAEELKALRKIRGKLPAIRKGLTPKNKALLREFDDPARVDRLLEVPQEIWAKALRLQKFPKKALVTAQKAVVLELLIHTPIRRRNLSSLSFSQHLSWASGPNGPVYLYLNAEETKNDREYHAELAEPLAGMLRHYRYVLIPAALGRSDDRLCVTIHGQSKTHSTLESQFKRSIRDGLGLDMSLHQMRHVMAKVVLDENPGAHELVRELLGHARMRSTRDYYAPVDTKRAVRHHDQVIARLRAEAEVKPKRRGKREKPKKQGPEAR